MFTDELLKILRKKHPNLEFYVYPWDKNSVHIVGSNPYLARLCVPKLHPKLYTSINLGLSYFTPFERYDYSTYEKVIKKVEELIDKKYYLLEEKIEYKDENIEWL